MIAAEVNAGSPDFGHLEPMVAAARRRCGRSGSHNPEVVVADAGYWHLEQIDQITARGSRC